MWVLYAFGSAFFAGITAILAKCGIKKTSSNVATALRTTVVLIFAWLMVFITNVQGTIADIDARSWVFLVLSGLATGASWLCYFRALQIGDVNKVVPIDKSSTVLTIILAIIFFNEEVTPLKIVCVAAIAVGTFLMIGKKKPDEEKTEKTEETEEDKDNIKSNKQKKRQILPSVCCYVGGFRVADIDSR